jgi:hypothetical protein
MDYRKFILDKFYAFADKHPDGAAFWGVLDDARKELGVPSGLIFGDDERTCCEWREQAFGDDWAEMDFSAGLDDLPA